MAQLGAQLGNVGAAQLLVRRSGWRCLQDIASHRKIPVPVPGLEWSPGINPVAPGAEQGCWGAPIAASPPGAPAFPRAGAHLGLPPLQGSWDIGMMNSSFPSAMELPPSLRGEVTMWRGRIHQWGATLAPPAPRRSQSRSQSRSHSRSHSRSNPWSCGSWEQAGRSCRGTTSLSLCPFPGEHSPPFPNCPWAPGAFPNPRGDSRTLLSVGSEGSGPRDSPALAKVTAELRHRARLRAAKPCANTN